MVQAVVVALVLALLTPLVLEEVARAQPTCESMPGLAPVDVAADILDGRASLEATPPHTQVEGERPDLFDVRRLFDARDTSVWAVPVDRLSRVGVTTSLEGGRLDRQEPLATVTLTFDEPVDLRLACVVNGVPLDAASYLRADRVRTARVRTSCDDEAGRRVELLTMPADRIHEAQTVELDCWRTEELVLEVLGVHRGEAILDVATQEPVGASGDVAVGEVVLYRPAQRGEEGWTRRGAVLDFLRPR